MIPKLTLNLDPGSTHTGWVIADVAEGFRIVRHDYVENRTLLESIRLMDFLGCGRANIEMIGHYGKGMPAGKDVFHTCIFIGQLLEAFYRSDIKCRLILRASIKTHLCGTPRAKDPNVRQALLDKLGPQGTKKNPGPTYGISSHKWSALAVAVYAAEVEPKPEEMAWNF